ncbi:DUF1905 domain-containing protein [Streptomyces sp. NBC_00445]
MIPAQVRLGGVAFETSLFCRDGCYLLPLNDAVRISRILINGPGA